jgi:putative FmdB family regulatory protein
MPIYEYACKKCRCEFEALIRNCQEEKAVSCPRCLCPEVDRIMSCFSRTSSTGETAGSGCSPGAASSRFS